MTSRLISSWQPRSNAARTGFNRARHKASPEPRFEAKSNPVFGLDDRVNSPEYDLWFEASSVDASILDG